MFNVVLKIYIQVLFLPPILRSGLDGGLWLGPLEYDISLLVLGLGLLFSSLGALTKFKSKSSSLEMGDFGYQDI